MRIIVFLWLVAGVCTCAQGQHVVASLELGRKEPRPLWFEYVKADSGLVTLSYMTRNSSRYIGVFKYDGSFHRQWSRQFLENDSRRNIVYLAVVGNRILVFVAEQPKGADESVLFYMAFDLAGNLTEDRVIVATFEAKRQSREVFSFARSINKRQLVVVQRQHNRADKTAQLRYLRFATEGTGFEQGEVDLNYADKQLALKQIEVANQGSIYVLSKKFEDTRDRQATYTLFRINPQSPADNRLLETPLYYPENHITDLTFKLDPQGTVFLGGFYSRRNADKVHGLIYTRLSAEDNVMETARFVPFDKTFLAKYLTRRQLDRDQALTDFYLDHIILRSDGGLLLVAEQYWVSHVAYTDAYGFISYREFHHYDDIAAFSLSPEGELEWTAVIPKQQTGEYQSELSYFPVVAPSGILFFYKARSRNSGSHVFLREITYEGKVLPQEIFLQGFRASDTFYRKACEQVTNTRALVVFSKARPRMFSMLKVALE
ncbi:MAG: hypothetical protein KF690_10835 [Bacteroidetes bacterium]|nr:hypothetical protein [Bacteroidota bacterium]